MSYYPTLGDFAGKAVMAPPPKPPPAPDAPIITPEEEMAIIQATMPVAVPEPSFLRRNAVPIFVGGGILLLATLGMILMLKL
jgi:hypothetical protein